MNLSPREDVICALADGETIAFVSAQMRIGQPAIKQVGADYGWPQNRRQIKVVAARLRAEGSIPEHAGPMPGMPWPIELPADPPAPEESTTVPTAITGDPVKVAEAIRASRKEPASVLNADTLALLDAIDVAVREKSLLWQDTPLTVEQAARVEAIRQVLDVTAPAGGSDPGAGPSAADVLTLAAWVIDGVRP